jgi:hypothetical protein
LRKKMETKRSLMKILIGRREIYWLRQQQLWELTVLSVLQMSYDVHQWRCMGSFPQKNITLLRTHKPFGTFLLSTSCLDSSCNMFGTPHLRSHVHVAWHHFPDCLGILYFTLHVGGTSGFLFGNFVMQLKWRSSITWFSQIWRWT